MTNTEQTHAQKGVHVRLERLLTTGDVAAGTRHLEAILDCEDIETEEVQEDNHGRQRIRIPDAGRDLFLKTLRGENQESGVDLMCDLTGALILEEWGLPVAPTSLVDTDEYGPALVMPFYEGGDGRNIDLTECANADELAKVYAFELWLRNDDDKPRHFQLTAQDEDDASPEFRAIDHGHALHRRWIREDILDDPNRIDDASFNPHGGPAADDPDQYGVQSIKDAEVGLDMIDDIPDGWIEAIVDESIAKIESLDTSHPDIQDFLDRKDDHRKVVVRLLKERRDGIFELAEDRIDE